MTEILQRVYCHVPRVQLMEMLNQETDPEIKKQKQNQETVGPVHIMS